LIDALAANGLHTEDLDGLSKHFFAFDDEEGNPVGFGGIEVHDSEGLLRSVVALPGSRGRGYGKEIVGWLSREATRRGVRRLYLLTTDARGFFDRCGFTRVERDSVPIAITRTEQFSVLCPASAVCMVREVST